MTKQQQQMMQKVKKVAEGPIGWGFANVHVNTIKLALSEIERLTTENQRLKNKCNSLWQAINQSTPEHYPSKDDLTWEVI
jgi:hypothetical protein